MIPSLCKACGHYALDLTGQVERLDSYLLEPGGPPPESAGDWHTKCLRDSFFGPAWCQARLRNFTEVRGYATVSQTETWTVIAAPRSGSRVALSIQGTLLALPPAQYLVTTPAGSHFREETAEYNLHLPDPDLIKAIQDALVRDGSCAMSTIFDRLELWPFLDHPELLSDARFIYDDELREDWGSEWVAAASECNVFVPPELVPLCA